MSHKKGSGTTAHSAGTRPHTTTAHPAHPRENITVHVNTNPDQGFFNAGEAHIHGTSTRPAHPRHPAHPAHAQPHLRPHPLRPRQVRVRHLRAHHLRPATHQQRRQRSRTAG